MSKPDYKVWVSIYEVNGEGEEDADGPSSLASLSDAREAVALQQQVGDFFNCAPPEPGAHCYLVRCEVEKYNPNTDEYTDAASSLCFSHDDYQQAVEAAVLVQDMCRHLLKYAKFKGSVKTSELSNYGQDWRNWLEQA
jgi:hypothetical protein